ncbi:MAG: IS66 family transposase [Candidatus Dormibacteraceae bacterium]
MHAKRGTAAMDSAGILNGFEGVAIHDGWKPYKSYEVIHGLCNAHHLRELKAAGEQPEQIWARELSELLLETKARVEAAIEAKADKLPQSVLQEIVERYQLLIAEGYMLNPKWPGRKQSTKYNLLQRLDSYRQDVLRFAFDFRVPFDNNQAERDIRMVRLQQKISGCWRTIEGAQAYLSVRSYISTARKQGLNALQVLERLFQADPWLPLPQPT